MKEIPLTQGKIALVDDVDYEQLAKHRWYSNKREYPNSSRWYAQRNAKHTDAVNGRKIVYMHQAIMGVKNNLEIDHINGDGLDNRRANLRFCSHSENMANQRKTRGSSIYKGVSWHKAARKWSAKIKQSGHKMHIGYFDAEEEAARAYDARASELYGEHASLNFPSSP